MRKNGVIMEVMATFGALIATMGVLWKTMQLMVKLLWFAHNVDARMVRVSNIDVSKLAVNIRRQ